VLLDPTAGSSKTASIAARTTHFMRLIISRPCLQACSWTWAECANAIVLTTNLSSE
jgi:hypothetical protein